MTLEVLRAEDRPATPWLNGGGVTREIAVRPAAAPMTDFDWRISLADVAGGGPFSVFPDVDRVITLVDGAGMALTVDGAERVLDRPFQPFAFPGDATTDCRLLAGPVVDFNVMTRRGRATARVDTTDTVLPVEPVDGTTVLVVCLSGTATLDAAGLHLDRFDAAVLPTGPDLVRADGTTAVVTIRHTA
ncbi:HutD family protein [Kitasatospora sp. NPDC059571]|uniref:HutD/Ves family protein n=1 Tax=Kitasatospora sp. NPDC059571 TaxID=3346871 RepID=UPI0036A8510C